jgi:hypothetical protein
MRYKSNARESKKYRSYFAKLAKGPEYYLKITLNDNFTFSKADEK